MYYTHPKYRHSKHDYSIYRKTPKKIKTPKKFAVITLKFEQGGFTIEQCVQKIQTEWQTV